MVKITYKNKIFKRENLVYIFDTTEEIEFRGLNMNIEESSSEDKIKGQVKLLVERIRTIENRRNQVEKEITEFKADVTEQKEILKIG